jgi:hypothetical protein
MNLIACPDVCTQQFYLNPNLITLLLIVLILFLYFKKNKNKLFLIIGLLLILITLFYYDNCGSGCLRDGFYIIFSFLPKFFSR